MIIFIVIFASIKTKKVEIIAMLINYPHTFTYMCTATATPRG